MAKLSYGDFRPLQRGEAGFSPTARRYVSPSTGEVLSVRQFQKNAAGSSLNQKAQQAEQKRVEKQQKPVTPASKTPPAKPTLSKSGKSGKKNLGKHVSKQYNQAGEVRRTRVNARSTSSLQRQIDRLPSSQGVIFHLIAKDGTVVKAVSNGKNHTANAGDFKQRINDKIAAGASWDDAFWEAIGESFDLYDEDGNPVSVASLSFTNIIMYAEAA